VILCLLASSPVRSAMVWTPETRLRVGDVGCGGRLSDAEFARIAPLLPPPKAGGRPRTTDVRKVLDAVFHLLRTGCQWRHLPSQFPPWQTVYRYLRAWIEVGVWDTVLHELRMATREAAGRESSASAAIIDSQSVKTTEKGGRAAGMRRRRSTGASATSWSTR
jgi:putative transposase